MSTILEIKPATIQNFIDGQWRPSITGKTAPNINPADTTQTLGFYQESGVEDAVRAIEAAQRAFPKWRKTPPPQRGKILRRVMGILEQRKVEFARIMTLEQGKSPQEAMGEVQKSINVLEFMMGEGRRLCGETIPSEMPDNFCYTKREPLGIVACITPWNFPVAIPYWKLAAALIAGNTVIFKPSSLTPWTAALVAESFQDAGLPAGVLNMITGSGEVVGEAIAKSPFISCVSFTGSTKTGSRIAAICGERMAKVQLEMGGKNPIIVLDDADLELAVKAAILGGFGSTGQRCTATSRVIVQHKAVEKFTEMLLKQTKKIQIGPHPDPKSYMGPLVSETQLNKVLHHINTAEQENTTLLTGGYRIDNDTLAKGYFVSPTIYTDVTPNMTIAQEEIFGPVLAIIEAKDLEDALMIANNSPYGLSSSIFTKDVENIFRYIDDIEVGLVHINSATIGGEAQVPFGGIKGSGLGGREQGKTAIETFTEWKVVYVDYSNSNRKNSFY